MIRHSFSDPLGRVFGRLKVEKVYGMKLAAMCDAMRVAVHYKPVKFHKQNK
jgi:hypothetical protein